MSFERQSFDAPRAFPLHQRGHQPGQLTLAAFGCTQPCTLGFSTSWRLFPSLPPVTPPSPTSPPQLRRGDETECCRRHDLYIKTPENPGGNERLCEKREEREREAARTEYKKLNEKGQEMKFSLPSE